MKAKLTNRISTPLFIGLALILLGPANVNAGPGDLDLRFGTGGKVTDWPGSRSAQGVAIQPDGKIVVVGGSQSAPGDRDFRIARYNSNGSIDTTFGGGTGRVSTDFGGFDDSWSVALQPDGKIVVGGTSQTSVTQGGFALARYHPDGSLDTSFGGGTGKIFTAASCWYTHYGTAADLALQADGKIVGVTGFGDFDGACPNSGLLLRYDTNGSLDTTFGSNGQAFTDYLLCSVDLEPGSGKLIAGSRDRIARFNSNGSPDTSFGTGGTVTMPPGFSTSFHAFAFDSDGRILAAGAEYAFAIHPTFAVFRFNGNGSLDTSFGGDGIVTTPLSSGDGFGSSVRIQPDGKILAAGTSVDPVTNSDFALVRYHPDGSLDTSFGGGDGVATVDFGNSSGDDTTEMVLDGQGRPVVVGESGGRFALARFQLTGKWVLADFDGDQRSDLSVFRPSEQMWYLNRSALGSTATQFGYSTDRITPADFDGDWKTDIAVFRDGIWYWLNSSNGNFNKIEFGLASDLPVPADFTGDGRADLAVYRGGTWWIFDYALNHVTYFQFGLPTDKPVVADYDGDGRADQAVYRAGVWHLNRSTLGYTAIQFGLATDKPVPADYDGDGRTDVGVYRDGTWYLLQSTNGFTAFPFGLATDTPAPADFDGDGKADVCVFRPALGSWYRLNSSDGTLRADQFGADGDRPIPGALRY